MVRNLVGALALAVMIGIGTQPVAAQGFAVGYTDIGPTIGIGGIGDASLAFGGRFEWAWTDLPELGNGVLGIQAGLEYYSWDDNFPLGDASVSYIPVGVTANYHFNLDNDQIDPFLGLGLGYAIINCDNEGFAYDCSDSELYFIGRAGLRYFVNDSWAIYGDIGEGAATLNVGAMYRLRG
ncbi:MAG: OmpW family outer membrane protein [Gemmatimonadota bacterium]